MMLPPVSTLVILAVIAFTLLSTLHAQQVQAREVQWTLTSLARHQQSLLSPQPSFFFSSTKEPSNKDRRDGNTTSITITVDRSQRYQSMRGIGSSLEASTCFNLNRLNQDRRQEIYQRLFDEELGIGLNLMRITIGTSDFCPLPFYSYDDQVEGSSDASLQHFNTSVDEAYIVPILQEILQYSSERVASKANRDMVQYFASPWSGPGFMKTSDALEGGRLSPAYYESYANYLMKFIQTYRDVYHIPVIAITPQNEPLANQGYPSTLLLPEHERELIVTALGQKMQQESVELWCFDHNWNTLFYPRDILNNSQSAVYVSGTAFHGYRGQPSAMTELHNDYPDKDIYFTEGSTFGIKGAIKIVEILRNWARTYNAWVTVLDSDLQPNAGPFHPQPPMIQIDSDSPNDYTIVYNFEYYMYGQFSKFIRRGAVRVASADDQLPLSPSTDSLSPQIESVEQVIYDPYQHRKDNAEDEVKREDEDHPLVHHVAFVDGDRTILVVVNPFYEAKDVVIVDATLSQSASITMPALSVATFVW